MLVKGLDCLSPGPGGFLGYKQTSGALDKRITPDGISYNHKAAPTPDTFHILDESADFFKGLMVTRVILHLPRPH